MPEHPITTESKSGGHRRPRHGVVVLLIIVLLLAAHGAILHQLLAKTAHWPYAWWIAVAAGVVIVGAIKHHLWRQWKIRKDGS
jgi:fructose-specific phosphotransferase system IIC component